MVGKDETSERGFFVQMMPHKRQGVQNLFDYPSEISSGNIQIIQMTFFFVEREKIIYKEEYHTM